MTDKFDEFVRRGMTAQKAADKMSKPRTGSDLAFEADIIFKRIKPMLAGRPSHVQSAVLGQLMAMWLAGHFPPKDRDELLDQWVKLVRDLVPVIERELFGPGGHPGRRS